MRAIGIGYPTTGINLSLTTLWQVRGSVVALAPCLDARVTPKPRPIGLLSLGGASLGGHWNQSRFIDVLLYGPWLPPLCNLRNRSNMGRVMNFIVWTLIIYCVFALPLAILIGKTIKSVDDQPKLSPSGSITQLSAVRASRRRGTRRRLP
jgi:hypothetical protein